MRKPLPNRRLQAHDKVEWNFKTWHVSVGFDNDGNVKEVFCKGAKTGSAFEALLDDILVLISKHLQCGHSLQEVYETIDRDADSQLGFIIKTALDLERSCEIVDVKASADGSAEAQK